MENTIRVIMVCQFSNPIIRERLPLIKIKRYRLLRKLMGNPYKACGYDDSAVWDTNMIDCFSKHKSIDLHVISGHSGLKRGVVSFDLNRVHYTFIRYEISSILKRIVRNQRIRRKIDPFIRKVHKKIEEIKPDLILLVGAENDGYSSSIIDITEYPVYVLCQTIYNNPDRIKYGNADSLNQATEMEIFQKKSFFGVYCKMHYDLLHAINPQAIVFKFGFPTNGSLLSIHETKKEYDFVNFSRSMSYKKGFHDSIKALSIVRKQFPNVTLNLIGNAWPEEKKELETLAQELGVFDSITFTPPFEKQSDLFLHVQKSRFALLPCMMDNTSGTMIQAMQLGLPLVVYKTRGTPSFNRENECVLIAEHRNVKDLAAKMTMLMGDSSLADTLRTNAREYQEKRAEYNSHNGDRLVANFKAIIANYHTDTTIPQEQLFNPEIDD